MNANADPLVQLRDIQLPETIGWWPMAPALWAALIGLLVVIALLGWLLWRWRNNSRYRRLTHRILQRHFADYPQHNDQALLCQQVINTLRRCLLSSNSHHLKSLASKPSRQLLQLRGSELFSTPLVDQLEQCLYGPPANILTEADIQQFQHASKRWLNELSRHHPAIQGPQNG